MAINLSKQDLLDMEDAFQKDALESGKGIYCKIEGNIVSIKNSLIDSSEYYGMELNISGKYGDFIVGSENAFSFRNGLGNTSQNAVGLTLSGENIPIGKLGDTISMIAFKYEDNFQSSYIFISKDVNNNFPYCTGNIIKGEPTKIQPINISQTNYLYGIIILLLIIIAFGIRKLYFSKK